MTARVSAMVCGPNRSTCCTHVRMRRMTACVTAVRVCTSYSASLAYARLRRMTACLTAVSMCTRNGLTPSDDDTARVRPAALASSLRVSQHTLRDLVHRHGPSPMAGTATSRLGLSLLCAGLCAPQPAARRLVVRCLGLCVERGAAGLSHVAHRRHVAAHNRSAAAAS